MSLMASFLLSFFPRDVLDLIESVSEGFPIYSLIIPEASSSAIYLLWDYALKQSLRGIMQTNALIEILFKLTKTS